MNITATVDTTNDVKVTVEKDLGANLEESAAKFTPEVVHANFVDAVVITVQSAIRRLNKAGKTQEEIQAYVDGMSFVGGARGPRKDPIEAFLGKFDTLTPEKQMEMLRALKEKVKAAQAQ